MAPRNERRPPLEREAPECLSAGERVADAQSVAPHAPRIHPLLVGAVAAAKASDVCERTWRSMDAQGLVPEAVRLGRRRLWSVEDLRDWVRLGCPSRERFKLLRSPGGRS